jgi:hypothetical protein
MARFIECRYDGALFVNEVCPALERRLFDDVSLFQGENIKVSSQHAIGKRFSGDPTGYPIYNISVLMCVATDFALVGAATTADAARRREIISRLERSGREAIVLTHAQIARFVANGTELQGPHRRILALSRTAHAALEPAQIALIEERDIASHRHPDHRARGRIRALHDRGRSPLAARLSSSEKTGSHFRRAGQRVVDDRRRPASLRDQDLVRPGAMPPSLGQCTRLLRDPREPLGGLSDTRNSGRSACSFRKSRALKSKAERTPNALGSRPQPDVRMV